MISSRSPPLLKGQRSYYAAHTKPIPVIFQWGACVHCTNPHGRIHLTGRAWQLVSVSSSLPVCGSESSWICVEASPFFVLNRLQRFFVEWKEIFLRTKAALGKLYYCPCGTRLNIGTVISISASALLSVHERWTHATSFFCIVRCTIHTKRRTDLPLHRSFGFSFFLAVTFSSFQKFFLTFIVYSAQ